MPRGRPDGTAETSAMFLVRASDSVADMTVETMSPTLYSSTASESWPASILERSSTSLIRPSRWRPLACTRSSTPCAFSGTSP